MCIAGCTALAGLDGDYTVGNPANGGAGPGTTSTEAGAPTSTSTGTAGGSTSTGGGTGAAGGAAPMGGMGGTPLPMWVVIDTLTIDCDTPNTVQSNVTLMLGQTYRLRASGTCTVIDTSSTLCDAEYMDFTPPQTLDNGNSVDMGIGINDPVNDLMKSPNWGVYTSTHVYEVPFVGLGAQITANFHDPNYSNNDDALTLEILELQ